MTFYRDTTRTARKEHKCNLCHGKIKVGEKYHDKAGNSADDDTVIFSSKECEPCQPVLSEFTKSDYGDDGYYDENIQEWWRDVKCWECQSYYLPCVPDDNCAKDFIKPDGSCPEKSEYGTCEAGDRCDDMTHYCRCEKFKQ